MKPYHEEENIIIYHGDCEKILPFLDNADLLLTDPPYGIGENDKKVASRGNKAKPIDYGKFDWDNKPPAPYIIDWLRIKTTYQIIFGGNYFNLPPSSCWLVWDKDNGNADFADCELAWTNLSTAVRKIKYRWQGMLQQNMKNKDYREHPTQKPKSVMMWAIQQAPDDCDIILDPFMGSGTTLLAAKELGRKAIGIEREEKYCEIARKRLAQDVFAF